DLPGALGEGVRGEQQPSHGCGQKGPAHPHDAEVIGSHAHGETSIELQSSNRNTCFDPRTLWARLGRYCRFVLISLAGLPACTTNRVASGKRVRSLPLDRPLARAMTAVDVGAQVEFSPC